MNSLSLPHVAPSGLLRGRSLAISTLVDGTGSIARSGLTEPIRATMTAFEQWVANHPEFRIRRAIFNQHRTFIGGCRDLLRGDCVRSAPFRDHYNPAGTTYLDVFLVEEIVSLLRRYRLDTAQAYTHLLLVVTDGFNEGPERHDVIGNLMDAVRSQAADSGGVSTSRIVVWYAGAGLTREDHVGVATQRYNIPAEWVLHVPATAQGIRLLGDAITNSATRIRDDGQTRIY